MSPAFSRYLRKSQKLGRKRGIVDCLVGLAGVAGCKGQPERAARLFGAAEALHQAFGTHIEHADRIEYDHNVAATRAQLDEATFTLAWAEGRAMTLEQAITAALGDND